MPGPGGGSNGGGFSGGGGGNRGGFSGGGNNHYHRGPMFYGGYYRRPYYGGGIFGALIGMLFLPIILAVLVVAILTISVVSAFSAVAQGGVVTYDESTFQTYANNEYAKNFGASTAYEDNIQIVFLTQEGHEEYYCIAWVGNHVNPKVDKLFGDENTAFGRAMLTSVAAPYDYSLTKNFKSAVDIMIDSINELGVESFDCAENHVQVESKIVNKTDLQIDTEDVDLMLERFTEQTGISIAITVEEDEDVFGRGLPPGTIATIIISLVVLGLLIFWIVKSVRARRRARSQENIFENGKL